jgi:hypothetical protein
MFRKQWIRRVTAVVVVLAPVVLSLALVTGVSEAQGGGGRGKGNSATGSGNGQGGQGMGMMNQNRAQTVLNGDCLCDGTGNQFGAAQGGAWNGSAAPLGLHLFPAVPGEVPAGVVEALNAGLQDEYRASAIYQAIIDQFGAIRPFTNIQRAEEQHIAALTFLFERYDLAVPGAAELADVPAFGSVTEACAAGVAAEEANFALYDRWIATAQDYPDIVQVFTALRNASEFSHLPAFEQCAG